MDSTVRVIFLGDAASAVRSVSTLEGRMGSLGGTAARTGKLLAGAIGVSLIGGLAKATSLAIGFDRSMRNVNSIAKLNETSLKRLEKQVLALGKVSGQAPKVLADGLYDIVSSGFKANDAIKILSVSAKAATAGMTDTATASKGVVAILNAYHLSADKAKNVSSLLFTEVNKGVNTFEELASQLGDTAPLAAQLKIPFSDVAAGLALITLHGTSMAEASTQMSRVMTDILKPSKGLSKELHSLGYESGQAAIQAHGFVPLIKQLSDAAHGSAGETAAWFGNIRSLRGMLNLTGPNLKKFNDFAKAMAKSFRDGGDDVKAFNEQSKSISVRWDKATASLSAAAIKLGTQLFPELETGIGYLSRFAGWLDKLSGEHSIKAKVEFVGQTAEDFAKHVQSLISGALFNGNKGANNPSTQRLQQPGMPVDLKFQQGFVQKAQDAILRMGGWDAIGAKIGSAIGSGLKFTVATLDNLTKTALAWANGPGGQKAAQVGAILAANLIITLTDPTFWAHHWQLALGVALAVLPVGKLGLLGETIARLGFRLFGATAGKVILAAFEHLPFGESTTKALRGLGEAVAKYVPDAIAIMVGFADKLVRAIGRGFGKLGALVKVALYTGIVLEISSLVGQAWGWGTSIAGELARGILHGLEGLPGKIANAVNPFHGSSGKPATVGGRTSPRGGKAAGDKIDRPMISWIGEDAPRWPEWVIPSNPKYRDRALGLMAQAQGAIGIPGFAKGGGPSGHHYTGHQIRPRTAVKAATGAAQSAINALTAAQARVADLGRTYDQDQRAQGAVNLPPLTVDVPDDPSDPTSGTHQEVNPAGIAAATQQLNQLVTEKNGILDALEQERQKIEAAITAVQAAIDELLDAIKVLNDKAKAEGKNARSEHRQAAAASASVSKKGGLQDQVSAERAKKKPNKAKITQLENAIRQAGRDHDDHEANAKASETNQGRYQKQAGDDASQVKDLRGTLGGLLSNRHDLPYDVRDQQIDVAYLQQQIAQVQSTTGTAPGAPSSSGGTPPTTTTGGDGGAATPDDSMLQALIQQLTDALGLQYAQVAVIQGMPSFASGIAYVPNDMVAQLHKGERVVTAADNAMSSNSTAADAFAVHLHGVAAIDDHVEAWVERNGVKIAAQVVGPIGRSADRFRRSGRARNG